MNDTPRLNYRLICLALLVPAAFACGLLAVAMALAAGPVGDRIALDSAQRPEVYRALWASGAAALACAGLALVASQRPLRGIRWARAALVLSLTALLLCADRVAAVIAPAPSRFASIFSRHPTRGWTHTPGARAYCGSVSVEINAQGLRGPLVPRHKPPGEYRILFVGDSTTFGFDLDEPEGVVARVRHRLTDPHQPSPTQGGPAERVLAINAGISGYATWQELDYLRTEGLALQPDLVVLGFCFNDFTDLIGLGRDEIPPLAPELLVSNARLHWSGLVRLAGGLYERRLLDRALRPADQARWEPYLIFADPPTPELARAKDRARADLERFDDFCRARALPWVLLVFPLGRQFGPEPLPDGPQRTLADWAARRGVRLCDPLPALQARFAAAPDERLFFDETHPTTLGSDLIAEILVAFLREHGLLPAAGAIRPVRW